MLVRFRRVTSPRAERCRHRHFQRGLHGSPCHPAGDLFRRGHPPGTYAAFAAVVGIGGAGHRRWIYARSDSLYGPWISHCFVDAAIFVVGYDLARELLVG